MSRADGEPAQRRRRSDLVVHDNLISTNPAEFHQGPADIEQASRSRHGDKRTIDDTLILLPLVKLKRSPVMFIWLPWVKVSRAPLVTLMRPLSRAIRGPRLVTLLLIGSTVVFSVVSEVLALAKPINLMIGAVASNKALQSS